MGWDSYRIYTTPKDECDRIISQNDDLKLIVSCLRGNEYYAVVDRGGVKFAAVFEVRYSPRAKYYNDNFCVKIMDETVEPYFYNMPDKYLKMLDPTDFELAKEWRKKCALEIDRKKRLTKIKEGQKITFAAVVETLDGTKRGDPVVLKKYRNMFIFKGMFKYKKEWIPANFEIISED